MSAINRLKDIADRSKINEWLDKIGETNKECRDEVLQQCKEDTSARVYYVDRYKKDCA